MSRSKSTLIAIAGGSGAGKSTLTDLLARRFGPNQTTVVIQDNYYRDHTSLSLEEVAMCNFDHPDEIDFARIAADLGRLVEGQATEGPRYCFKTHARLEGTEQLLPRPILILEGLFALHDPLIRLMAEHRIFVDVDEETRLARRLERDTRERGRSPDSVLRQYMQTVRPMHEQFVVPQRDCATMLVESTSLGAFDAAAEALFRGLTPDADPVSDTRQPREL